MRHNPFHILFDIFHSEKLPYVPYGYLFFCLFLFFLRLLLLLCVYTATTRVVFLLFFCFVLLRVTQNAVGENIKNRGQ